MSTQPSLNAPPAFTIRDFAPADQEAAIALIDQLNRHEAAAGASRRTGRAAAEDCVAEDAERVAARGGRLVLESGGEVLAYASWYLTDIPAFVPGHGSQDLFVENLVVAERARGRGYGKAMLAALEARAREAGAKRMVLHAVTGNNQALAVYEKAGFAATAYEMVRLLGKDSEQPA